MSSAPPPPDRVGDPSPPTDAQLIARDYLALDRTRLANERTVLAYTRTALAFLIAGLSLIHFFPQSLLHYLGWIFIPLAILTMTLGIRSYTTATRRMNRHLR